MGYTTDFIGHVDIEPHLNAGEIAYLEAFRHARHFDRGGSAYDVPGNPLAPDHEGVPNERYNALVRRRRDSPAARARARGAGTVVDLGRRRS